MAAKVDARPNRDVLFGLAIGLAIAGYTLVDSEGLGHADPLAYLFLVAAVCAVAYCGGLVATGQGGELRKALNPRSLLTAAAVFGAYAMVLAALELAPAASVAAVRESSVVIVAVFAWLFLGEPRRLTATAPVAPVWPRSLWPEQAKAGARGWLPWAQRGTSKACSTRSPCQTTRWRPSVR
jgi:uncharacterized membrane protein